MRVSRILEKMNIESRTKDEIEFDFMGLNTAVYQGTLCTFIDNPKYLDEIKNKSVIIITTDEIAENSRLPAVIVESPRICFFKLHNYLVQNNNPEYARKKFDTTIGKQCEISNLAHIESKNIIIGNNVKIEEFVSIKENTVIGDNVTIRSGSVIGSEGFEEKRTKEGILPIIHAGGVKIESNVEIQHNVCVDKAVYPWDDTVIGRDCKLDNLIHIGHAAKIKKETLIAANSLVGGRTMVGERVWIGVSATISNNIIIGDDAKINIGAVVTKNVNDGQTVSGNFAIEHDRFLDFIKSIR